MSNRKQEGFTAVELLVTLFVAAAFLIAGYQLFSLVIRDGGQARSESRAGNIAYDYLRRYTASLTNPCIAQTPLTDSPITITGLVDVRVSVAISCPIDTTPSLSKVTATVTYNNPVQTVSYATYVNGGQ
jgi:prepilin-type N-terminal cleavage/methylation domain-containing protein